MSWQVVLWPWYVVIGVLGVVVLGRLALLGLRLFTAPLPSFRKFSIGAQGLAVELAEADERRDEQLAALEAQVRALRESVEALEDKSNG